MHGIAEFEVQARERVRRLIRESRSLEPAKRLEVLRTELDASIAERKLMLAESVSLLFGGGGTAQLVGEDPRFDDGEVWDEVGINRGRTYYSHLGRRGMTRRDLDMARAVCRYLREENEYVIGSLANRVNYTVGEGLVWRVVPKDRMAEDRSLTLAANEALEEFREAQLMDLVEQEWVEREDVDGESILRVFANADGPMEVRFVEPETLTLPPEVPAGLTQRAMHALSLGVEVDPRDVRNVLAYWIQQDLEYPPERVPVSVGMGIRHVHHGKLNVHLSDPRGWPTYWPVRRNMARAEKLLRNMSYVAALQAAIALIRKHEQGNRGEIEELLARHADLTVNNRVTGKTEQFRGVSPGTVIDGGPGVSYEAPVSSVNAANNVQVLDADLRGAAVAAGQPQFMFTGKVDGGFASEMVAEGPHHKAVRRRQSRERRPLRRIHWDALKHEVFWGRLDERVLRRYRLEVDFPDPLVRDHLQQTQRYQIMRSARVISAATWQAREGINPEEERRKLEEEQAREKVSGDVQTTALNGAQVTSLQGIVQSVALRQLPAESAVQMIMAAFPTLDRERVEAMVLPAAGMPAPAPGAVSGAPAGDLAPGVKPPAGSTPGGPGGADHRGNPDSPETTAARRF